MEQFMYNSIKITIVLIVLQYIKHETNKQYVLKKTHLMF